MGNCQCKNCGDESILAAVEGSTGVVQHDAVVGKTIETSYTTNTEEFNSPRLQQQPNKTESGALRRSFTLVLPKLKTTITSRNGPLEDHSSTTPNTLPETPSTCNSSFADTPSPQSNSILSSYGYGEQPNRRSTRQHRDNNINDEEDYDEQENTYLDFTPISNLISAMDPTIKEEDSVLLDESIHERSQSGGGGENNDQKEPEHEESTATTPMTTFAQHASALIAATAAAAAGAAMKKKRRSKSSPAQEEQQEKQEQHPNNENQSSLSFMKKSSTTNNGVGRMQNLKMRIQAKSKSCTLDMESERPKPLTMSELISRSETPSTASTEEVKNKNELVSSSSLSSSLHSSVSQQTKSSMNADTMLTFHKLRLRAKVAARDKRKHQRMQKFEDRLSDVTTYGKLVKGFESLQEQIQQQEQQKKKNEKDEPSSNTSDDPNRMNLKKAQTWFFDFQGIEREDDFNDVDQAEAEDNNVGMNHHDNQDDNESRQSAMSLLTCESWSSQKAYYAEKRKQRRDRKRANDDQCSQSDLSLLSGSSMDSQRKYFREKQKQRQQKVLLQEEKDKRKLRHPLMLEGEEINDKKKEGLIPEIIVPSKSSSPSCDRIVLESLDNIAKHSGDNYDLEDAGSLCSLITEEDVYDYGIHRRNRKANNGTTNTAATTTRFEHSDNHSVSSAVTGVDSVLTDDWGGENDYAVSRTNRKLAFDPNGANRRSRSHPRTRKSSENKYHGEKKKKKSSDIATRPHLTEIVLSNNVDKYADNVNAAAAAAMVEDDDTSLQALSSSARQQQRLRLFAKMHGIQTI